MVIVLLLGLCLAGCGGDSFGEKQVPVIEMPPTNSVDLDMPDTDVVPLPAGQTPGSGVIGT